MSLPLVQPDSGLVSPDELRELVPLPEVLGGAAFIPASGRVYRLFGNEERAFEVPTIPEIPAILAAPKSSALSLKDALQQIESFSLPATSDKVSGVSEQPKPTLTVRSEEHGCEPTISPTCQSFRALERKPAVPDRHGDVGTPLKLVKSEGSIPHTASSEKAAPSAKDVVREASLMLPVVTPKSSPKSSSKLNEEKRSPLRIVVSEHIEEPFIVPFAKPESVPEATETKNTALKIVTELIPPIFCSKVLKKWGQHRRRGSELYQKRFSLPPVSVSRAEELPVASVPKSSIDTSTFQWPAQLVSLMQTANNQIRMLTDHLVVQLNQGIKAICFKSVFPGDGCSTILLCAVRALMERNYRILLIDAHHRHLDLQKQFNLSRNSDTGNEVITLNDQLGLWVWQESKTAAENTDLIAEIITTHHEAYDMILLDDGSVTESPLTEFVAFWHRVGLSGVILVSNTKRPAKVPVSHIAERIRQHHIPLIGITENYV